jgi:predicted O-methyltransferase YrrM
MQDVTKFNEIEGFLTDKEQRCLLKLAADADCVVEIGAFKGKSTCVLASQCHEVYSIDPHISNVEHKG